MGNENSGRRRKLWVAREGHGAVYGIFQGKPIYRHGVNYCTRDGSLQVARCYAEDFEPITGVRLEPGECRAIKSIEITLEKPKGTK